MNLLRALSVLGAAAALSLGFASTCVAGRGGLMAVVDKGSDNRICLANGANELATVDPTTSDADLSLLLILPDSADAEKISVDVPTGWVIRAREFQKERHALVFAFSPTQPVAVKGQTIAACFEIVGIRTDELGPIGVATAVHVSPENAPRARR